MVRSLRTQAIPVSIAVMMLVAVFVPLAGDATPGARASYGPLPPPPAFEPEAAPLAPDATDFERHLALARIGARDAQLLTDPNAQGDGIMAPHWCFAPQGVTRSPDLFDRTQLEPTRVSDNLSYIGMVWLGQYVLETADGGFVLFDTLSNAEEVESQTKPGLRQLGLDPADLRAIFITHGHFDHDGGVASLQAEFGVPVYIGSADADLKPYDVTTIDSTVTEPQQVTVGGTTVTAMASPGHTAGTISFLVQGTYQGEDHTMAMWGGSGFPRDVDLKQEYRDSAGRMWFQVFETGADMSSNSHAFFDDSLFRIREIIAQGGIEDSNPMVQDNETVLRSFYVLRQCAAAHAVAASETAQAPEWRLTDTDLYAAEFVNGTSESDWGRSNVAAAARVSNFFEVLEGQEVEFSVDGSDESCVARTDDQGVAMCRFNLPASDELTIEAEFAGTTVADGSAVDLPSRDEVMITP